MGFQFKPLSGSADGRPLLIADSEGLIHTGRDGASQILTLKVYNSDASARTVTIEIAGQSALTVVMSVEATSLSEEVSFAIQGEVAVTAVASAASVCRLFGHVVEDHGGGPRS